MIDISTKKHNVAFPSRVQSAYGGGHIYDIELTADHDNGEFVSKGEYISLGTYKEAEAGALEGKIVEVATNGHYYVEITKEPEKEVLFLHQPVVSPYTEKKYQAESLWVNKVGDVIKGYSLHIGDIIEEAAEGFDGTPEVGKAVSVAGGKLKVATEA